jgi:DNA-binding NtrC family response regulator
MNINNKILYTWLGNSDRRAYRGGGYGNGPVADAVLHLAPRLTHVVLMADVDEARGLDDEAHGYLGWLHSKLEAMGHTPTIQLRPLPKGDPTRFDWVYDAMRRTLADVERQLVPDQRYFLVGPGTPTMATCTLLMARREGSRGELWQVDAQSTAGCRPLELPFDLQLWDAPDPASGTFDRTPAAQAAKFEDGAIVQSPGTRRTFALAARAATSEWPVLILGPTGSGKEVLAQAVHATRGRGRWVPVNCGAIPESLLEAKLFGHKKGAFTGASADAAGVFEEAGEGTVFLDEVGELPLQAQTRLLRVLQERKVTRVGEHQERSVACRIVAATHRNLLGMVREGRFREDLYFRLAGIILRLEPLRDRPEDLTAAIDQFWQDIVENNPGFPGRVLNDQARARLMAHGWPGNLRELKTVLVRAAFIASDTVVGEDDILSALDVLQDAVSTASAPAVLLGAGPLKQALNEHRRQLALQAVREAGGNKSQAARRLGITPQHLARLLKR